jgi:hypothetical protein
MLILETDQDGKARTWVGSKTLLRKSRVVTLLTSGFTSLLP